MARRDTRTLQDYLGHRNIRNVRYTKLSASKFKNLWPSKDRRARMRQVMTEHAEKEFQRIKPDASVSFRRPRWVPTLVVVALATVAILAVASVREPVLRAAGWALVINEPISPADIIVVSAAAYGAGALEAADLVQSGIARRVAVFSNPPREKTTSSSVGGSQMRPQGRFGN
jgi:hypothetical protein